jgi:hypothetical protein
MQSQPLLELRIDALEILEEALEREDTETGIQASCSGADRVHAELRNAAVNGADARGGAEHGAYGTAAAAVVADLEHLELGVLHANANVAVDAALQNGGRHGIRRHVGVGVGRDGRTDVQAGAVVLQVCVEEVGVDSMDHVAADQERVGVCPAQRTLCLVVGKLLDDTLHDAGQEVAPRALSEQ